jgi:hypothetical protein
LIVDPPNNGHRRQRVRHGFGRFVQSQLLGSLRFSVDYREFLPGGWLELAVEWPLLSFPGDSGRGVSPVLFQGLCRSRGIEDWEGR